MKKLLLYSGLFAFGLSIQAQQDPQYTQFMFNKQLYNPATVGFTGNHCVNLLVRSQYGNFNDQTYTLNTAANGNTEIYGKRGSRTATFSYGAPLPFAITPNQKPKKFQGGLGASFFTDRVGYFTSTVFKLDAGIRKELDMNQTIGLGLNVGAMQRVLDFAGFLPKDPGDPLISTITNGTSSMKPTIGLGAWYQNSGFRNLSLGYSIQNINRPKFSYQGVLNDQQGVHHYLNAGAEFQLNGDIELLPFLMVKASQASGFFANPDINLAAFARYRQNISAGIALRSSFRTFESASIIIGYNVNPALRIGYSFDFNATQLRLNNSNTHEFVLNYCFELQIKERPVIRLDDPFHLGKSPEQE